MDRLKARCPYCSHEEEVTSSNVLLIRAADPGASTRALFSCKECQRRVSFNVSESMATLLVADGARAAWGHPSMQEHEPRPDGPPFTYDDLLDLHELLERPDWFEQLLMTSTR